MRHKDLYKVFSAGERPPGVFANWLSLTRPGSPGTIGQRSEFRSALAAAALAIVTAISVATVGQYARADHSGMTTKENAPPGGSPSASANVTDGLSYELGIGDRLRIKIYEREDLSGETRVRPEGSVVVPLLGAFNAAGRHTAKLEQEIAEALFKRNAKLASVTIDVVEWRPIFAVGIVDKPGTYPFVPGMTALHALAAAGGLHRPMATTGLIFDAAREAGQFQRARAQLGNALAREARLRAEQLGQEEFVPPSRLLDVVGPTVADRITAAETRLLQERAASHRQQLTSFDEEIALTLREIAAIQAQYAAASSQTEATNFELAEIDAVAKRGLADKMRLLGVRREAASAEGQAHAILVSRARSERALASSKHNRTMLDLNRKLRIEEELKTAQEEIRSHELALSVSGEVLRRIGGELVGPQVSEPRGIYRIMRLVGSRHVLIEAEETTPLQPGDLVRVSLNEREFDRTLRPWTSAQPSTK